MDKKTIFPLLLSCSVHGAAGRIIDCAVIGPLILTSAAFNASYNLIYSQFFVPHCYIFPVMDTGPEPGNPAYI